MNESSAQAGLWSPPEGSIFFTFTFLAPIGAFFAIGQIHHTAGPPMLMLYASYFRGRLAPAKAEKLIVLKENLQLVEDFKRNSLYKLPKSEHNAFAGVEMDAVAGEGPVVDEEELELYLDDLAAEEEGEGVEDGAEGDDDEQ